MSRVRVRIGLVLLVGLVGAAGSLVGARSSAQIALPIVDGGPRTPTPPPVGPSLPTARAPDPEPQGSIRIVQPMKAVANEDPHFDGGRTYPITWTATNTTSNLVAVWLTPAGRPPLVISGGTTATSLSYTVPVTMPPGVYELRVMSSKDQRVYAVQNVEVRAPTIEVLVASSVDSCSSMGVSWRAKGDPGPSNVRVVGPAGQVLATNAPYTEEQQISEKLHTVKVLVGRTSWTVPQQEVDAWHRVEVSSVRWPSIKGDATVNVKAIRLTVPDVYLGRQSETKRVAQPITFTWGHGTCLTSDRVKIEILNSAGTKVLLTPTASVPMEPSALAWSLPAEYCDEYEIRITDLNKPTLIGRARIKRPAPQVQVHPGPDTETRRPSWCVN